MQNPILKIACALNDVKEGVKKIKFSNYGIAWAFVNHIKCKNGGHFLADV